jgi:signal transduction histidine kinase
LQELEHFLREAQETSLLASARSLAGSLPMEFQSQLLFAPDLYLPLREFERAPILDGYNDDWPAANEALTFSSEDGVLQASLLAGAHENQLYLLLEVNDRTPEHTVPGAGSGQADGVQLLARNPRGLLSFSIKPEAPGPLKLYSEAEGGGQVDGYWLEFDGGYRLELSLPSPARNSDISFQVRDVASRDGITQMRQAGPLDQSLQRRWINLQGDWQRLSDWFATSAPEASRTWLVDRRGWVLADSGVLQTAGSQQTTWLQRLLYRLVAGSRTELLEDGPGRPFGFDEKLVQQALSGKDAIAWSQDLETAVVRNAVAVPLRLEGEIEGAIVLQSSSEGLLLVTNRALGRLLFTTLALTLGLAAGLWFFATRLSSRVRRLSGAVSQAMERGVDSGALPLITDRDELGELARNNDKLLRAVADYTQYLQTLAGKLSHELNTPLAITRSSLDNLSSQDLDPAAVRYLDRAREGLDRQSAIVRAMSEASRLEASIAVAEWEETDLVQLLTHCAEAYASVHAGRRLVTELPPGPVKVSCSPELLAQALDKLVDNAMSLCGPEDTVTLGLQRKENLVAISVRNSGTRLPAEFQDRLFDSLVSLRDKRGALPHLGLGLYIVKLVAAAHAGSVAARNLPGRDGVEFIIELPLGRP